MDVLEIYKLKDKKRKVATREIESLMNSWHIIKI